MRKKRPTRRRQKQQQEEYAYEKEDDKEDDKDETNAHKRQKKTGGSCASSSRWRRWTTEADPDCVMHNPHCHQVLYHPDRYRCLTDLPFRRSLVHGNNNNDDNDKAITMTYRRRTGEAKTVLHWGQRKLLLAEMEFLLECGADARLVVYAGAAPGTHLALLSELFPQHTWELIDPAPFTVQPSSSDASSSSSASPQRIRIRRALFTDEDCARFAPERPLFISDIRSADPALLDGEALEEQVQADMELQRGWHRKIDACHSLLKFRLPWDEGVTEYLEGDLRFPIWGPVTTSETRLICHRGAKDRMYDNRRYCDQLFFFNTVARVALYECDVTRKIIDEQLVEGLDHCLDCRSEVDVLERYVRSPYYRSTDADADAEVQVPLHRAVASLSNRITEAIGGWEHRTLASGNLDPEERTWKMQRNQWIDGMPAYFCDGDQQV